MADRSTFVVDGAIDQPTGGYLYDRLVVEGLRALGRDVRVRSLSVGSLVEQSVDAVRFAREVAALEAGDTLVVDELCHPRVAVAAALHRVRSTGPRLVVLVHHLAASEPGRSHVASRLALERLLVGAADRVVVTSETTRTAVVSFARSEARVRVVPPGCDRFGLCISPPTRASGSPLRVLFLGSLTPRKGALDAVRAFGAVAHRATLTLAGPSDRDATYGRAVARVAAKCPGRVRLTGSISDADVARALATHDVLVAPSTYEGYGIAIAEALAHGLAVVTTPVGGIPEVTGDAAIFVTPNHPPAIARALARLAEDPGFLSAMQHHAIQRASQLPRWSSTIARFDAALGELEA